MSCTLTTQGERDVGGASGPFATFSFGAAAGLAFGFCCCCCCGFGLVSSAIIASCSTHPVDGAATGVRALATTGLPAALALDHAVVVRHRVFLFPHGPGLVDDRNHLRERDDLALLRTRQERVRVAARDVRALRMRCEPRCVIVLTNATSDALPFLGAQYLLGLGFLLLLLALLLLA